MRITTENIAKITTLVTGGKEECKYVGLSFDDMLNPKPIEIRTSEEVIESIRNKLQRIGGKNI